MGACVSLACSFGLPALQSPIQGCSNAALQKQQMRLSATCVARGGFAQRMLASCKQRRAISRARTVDARAMVNVDFASPSMLLGTVLIGCGVVLLQVGTTPAATKKAL